MRSDNSSGQRSGKNPGLRTLAISSLLLLFLLPSCISQPDSAPSQTAEQKKAQRVHEAYLRALDHITWRARRARMVAEYNARVREIFGEPPPAFEVDDLVRADGNRLFRIIHVGDHHPVFERTYTLVALDDPPFTRAYARPERRLKRAAVRYRREGRCKPYEDLREGDPPTPPEAEALVSTLGASLSSVGTVASA